MKPAKDEPVRSGHGEGSLAVIRGRKRENSQWSLKRKTGRKSLRRKSLRNSDF